MPSVIGIRFKDSGKIYHFDPHGVELTQGDWAIVETVRGPELGRVANGLVELAADDVIGELKPVLRRATDADLSNLDRLREFEPEAVVVCEQKVGEHRLPMQLVKAEYNFDGSRLTFFFTAEKRVDFRALVRDLARTFRTRIELRQVGPRDEAKLLGGIGPCGRLLCCSTFLPDFARVSIKMAKDQDLPLNPSKISGVCGRLLCCLSYEHEQYLEIKSELPARGDWVQTPQGPGDVVMVNVVRETVTVQLTDGATVDCTAAEIGEVRRRVASEARTRNAAGVTPASQSRRGDVGERDNDDFGALADLSEEDLEDSASQPRPALRPEALLGASLGQRRVPERQPQPPRESRVTQHEMPSEPSQAAGDEQRLGRISAGAMARKRRRRQRRPDEAAPAQQAAAAIEGEVPAQDQASQPQQASAGGFDRPVLGSRRRKRSRGK